MQVRWTAPAAKDLQEIAHFIQKDNSTAARAVATALFDAANGLDLFSMKGRSGRIAGTRELAIPGLPYIIVYQLSVTTIEILHIYHGARNWPGAQ